MVDKLMRQLEQLRQDRTATEAVWRDIALYCLPNRHDYANLPNKEIYDATAILSLQVLAAGFEGYLINPSQKWFSLRYKGLEEEDLPAEGWLKQVEDKMYEVLADSAFYAQAHECWLDLGAFGTAGMYSEENPEKVMVFHSRPPFEIFFSENEKGEIDTVFRCFQISVRQAVAIFEKVPSRVREMYEKGEVEEKVKIVHAVFPNPDYTGDDGIQKRYASVYWEEDSKMVLSQSGYFEMPFFMMRFYRSSNGVYGFSPAMVVLPEIKVLQQIVKDLLEATEMAVFPPVDLPADGYVMPIKIAPKQVLIRNRAFTGEGIKPVLTVGNLPLGEAEAEKRREAIRKAFFVDLFLMLAQAKNMTATEVVKRVEEKMLLLAPVLFRVISDFLNPLVHRLFASLVRQGAVEPPQEILSGEYSVVYTSTLARAQKLSEISSVQGFLEMIGALAQMSPESLDNVNFDAIVRDLKNILHINPKYYHDLDEVEQMRQIRQMMMAQEAVNGQEG